jgi:hypothetical protein
MVEMWYVTPQLCAAEFELCSPVLTTRPTLMQTISLASTKNLHCRQDCRAASDPLRTQLQTQLSTRLQRIHLVERDGSKGSGGQKCIAMRRSGKMGCWPAVAHMYPLGWRMQLAAFQVQSLGASSRAEPGGTSANYAASSWKGCSLADGQIGRVVY